jgi:hypothetical protein
MGTLGAERKRILDDAYFDSVIGTVERDKRIAELDGERTALNAIASREKPRASLSLDMLVDTFAPSRNLTCLTATISGRC